MKKLFIKNKSYPTITASSFLFSYEYSLLAVLSILLLAQKLPFIFYNDQLNPDESQMLTQAITLAYDPVFWRSVDGTTGGPINSYLILLLKYIGFSFDYFTLHLLSVVLIIISLFTTYCTLRLFYDFKSSFLSLLIPFQFFFFTNHGDFNHYNSELPSVTLLTAGVFLLGQIFRSAKNSFLLVGTLGLVCGLVPLAKLQGGPLAFLYIFCAFLAIIKGKLSTLRKSLLIVSMGSGIMIVATSLFVYLIYNHLMYDFYIMYIKTNLSHYNPGNSFQSFIKLFFKSSYDYVFFLISCFLLWIVATIMAFNNRMYSFFYNKKLWFLLLNATISLLVVTKTGYIFEHYLFYTIFPITLLTAYSLNQILESGNNQEQAYRKVVILSIGLLIGSTLVYALKLPRKNQNFTMTSTPLHEKRVARLIKKYSKPTDCLVVWGWNMRYHTLSGLRQGTKENHSIRCMTTNSLGAIHDPQLIAYYGRAYIDDLKRNNPPVFIDEVKANRFFENPEWVVHENIPGLKQIIADKYQLLTHESGVSVYIRKGLL
ncbi:hypothetical protein ACS5NO_16005 [Larkinella sp. GY13]|uniref:hypothetical protein n=1 Tax=Larkinella sp. GY13 TaxID=3453720 RepID=UPI003EE95462